MFAFEIFEILENPYFYRALPVPASWEGIDFDSDDLFPGLSDLQKETKLKTLKQDLSHYAKKHFDKNVDEGFSDVRTGED